MSQDVGLLHVYGYRRDGGPFYIGGPSTVAEGIVFAEDALKDRRRGFVRAEIKDIRAAGRNSLSISQIIRSSHPTSSVSTIEHRRPHGTCFHSQATCNVKEAVTC